ncbi:hypothetical protein TNCV_2021521 [Trichonephila clavipes]|nr:hypothetical protein TNCV_2021521 [Trichonephila clavipes]
MRVEKRDESLDYPRFVKPVFTKDSKPLWKSKKIPGTPQDCDTCTHLKKKGPLRRPPKRRIPAKKNTCSVKGKDGPVFDEAHFWLNGYVNKQNCRIWSDANPQVYVETPLHPEKLTVWCALWAGGIFLQKR